MEATKTIFVTNRDDWRRWLEEHHKSESEIWLIYYRKETGKPRISYQDAVKEALCFGWIDSQTKNLDSERFAQRFTPRKPQSTYSQTNKERLGKLIKQGKVLPEVINSLGDIGAESFEYPPDIMAALKANQPAWDNFQKYPGPYKRIRVAFIDAARNRAGEFEKRLNYFIGMTEQDKKYGYGIEEFF
jgi:uncharacterized protein YdeI (YjbR/CyaY-like superfamily)